MSINYTVLKSSIIYSSIWNEDSDTCKVWITMLAMRNRDGEVFGSIGGLAHTARVSPEKTKEALDKFLSPEGDSSSRDDGRRIELIPGGWRLLNHEKIKEEAKQVNKTSYMRQYMRQYMAKRRNWKKAVAALKRKAANESKLSHSRPETVNRDSGLTAPTPVGCSDLLGHTGKDEMLKKSLAIPDHKIMKRYDSF